eukprot:s1552_g4.t1
MQTTEFFLYLAIADHRHGRAWSLHIDFLKLQNLQLLVFLIPETHTSAMKQKSPGLTPLHSSGVKAQLSTLKMLLALKADPEDGACAGTPETETSMPRNIFHMLLADDREPLQCIQWLLNFLFSEDHGETDATRSGFSNIKEAGAQKLAKLLDHEDRVNGLLRPADLVRQGRLRQVLVQALRKARQRSDEDLFSGPSKTRSP